MSERMAVHPKPEDQVKSIVSRINAKVRISTMVAVFFFMLSAIIVAVLAYWGVGANGILPIYGYFIGPALFEFITFCLILLTMAFVYERIDKDDESASSSALVIGVIALCTGNVTAGIVLLIARQFMLTRLDIHYNFK